MGGIFELSVAPSEGGDYLTLVDGTREGRVRVFFKSYSLPSLAERVDR